MRCVEWDLRDQEHNHGVQVLVPLPGCPGRSHEREDDDSTEHHCEKLGLKNRKLEALDDDGVESAESRRGQGGANLDQHVAVGLGIGESLLELVGTELLVLKTGLVGSDTLNH